MIRPIYWPGAPSRHQSPFEPTDSSPLRLTEFYPSDPADQPAVEAISCLRELAAAGAVELIGGTAIRRLDVDKAVTESANGGYRAVTVTDHSAGTVKRTGIFNWQQWQQRRDCLAALGAPIAEQLEMALAQAAAHEALANDILSTTDSFLLDRRDDRAFRHLNICEAAEGCRLVGLLLRSRDDYRINHYFLVDREGFYWPLMRDRLPGMWRYFSACVYAQKSRGDDILYLAQSILTRAKWALEARDEVGVEFYRRQTNTTADRMTYHVGYLATLLMGALDSAARVAVRAYGYQ